MNLDEPLAPLNCIFAFIAILWTILTILNQLNISLKSRLLGWDKIGVIPGYSFFAPRPGRFDYHVLVRFEKDHSFSRWFEIGPRNQRRLISFFFNPEKRLRKAVIDLTTQLVQEDADLGTHNKTIPMSYPYLAFLLVARDAVRRLAPPAASVRYQFLLMVSQGRQGSGIQPIFLSNVHLLESGEAVRSEEFKVMELQ
jgi:hypothetical protein